MADDHNQDSTVQNETSRLEAFSDSVFTVSMTLLGLDLIPPILDEPRTAARLAELLVDRWPTYLAFLSTFGTILILWLHHHALFRLIQRADISLKLVNGFLLLLVTAAPFPTAMLAEYLGTEAEATAAATYAGLFFLVNVAYNLLWWTARRHDLLRSDLTEAQLGSISRIYLMGGPFYLVALAAAFWNAYVSMAICSVLWIVWAFRARDPNAL